MAMKITHRRLWWCHQYELTGYSDAELHELQSMEYRDLRDKIVEVLDDHFDGMGTYLFNCIGIRTIQFSGRSVLIKTNL